jgi:hypothetical protein
VTEKDLYGRGEFSGREGHSRARGWRGAMKLGKDLLALTAEAGKAAGTTPT